MLFCAVHVLSDQEVSLVEISSKLRGTVLSNLFCRIYLRQSGAKDVVQGYIHWGFMPGWFYPLGFMPVLCF